ncbi:MAG: hypothetical protein HYU60_04070 [Magnetospirillum sp.]|nr:hypothetical protein [Magnetospirillum sp.]
MTARRSPRLAAAALAAAMLVAPVAQAIDVDLPTAAQSKPSNPDIWRSIKQGAQGQPSATGGDATLIRPIPGCADRAVGFTTPVNANVPPVGAPQGQGPSTSAMALLAVLFGLGIGAGAMLARNLGRHPEA